MSERGDRLRTSLEALCVAAAPGDRLPTVRQLMREHGVGQATVQAVIGRLKRDGLVSAHVGRGTFVTRDAAAIDKRSVDRGGARFSSLLILSNASMNERCARVQRHLVDAMKATGGRSVQMSYHDTEHLMTILASLPSFDGIVLQSHYETMPVRLLALLQERARALVIDGHAVTGIDVDRIGVDWEQALALALDHLVDLGHRRIALVSLDSSAQPILSVRRLFDRLDDWRGVALRGERVVLRGIRHPTQPVAEVLADALDALAPRGTALPVSALVFVGVSDALGIRDVLARRGLRLPDDVGVVLLGHPDVPGEHLGLFTMVGGGWLDGAHALLDTMRARLADPCAPPGFLYLGCRLETRSSTLARASSRPTETDLTE